MALTFYNFGKTLASNGISFPKCCKFDEDIKKGKKNSENVSSFVDNCI